MPGYNLVISIFYKSSTLGQGEPYKSPRLVIGQIDSYIIFTKILIVHSPYQEKI